MPSRINVGITGDNSGLQTAINESKRSLKDLTSDFSRKASELGRLSGKLGEAQRKLVLNTGTDAFGKSVGNSLNRLNSSLNEANGLYRLNGDRIALVKARSDAYTATLTELYRKGLSPSSETAKQLSTEIRKLNNQLYVLEGPKRAEEALKKLREEEEKAARAAQRHAAERKQAFSQLANITKNAGQNMTLAITAPLAAVATMSLKAYGELDALRRGLAVVEGSADKAMQRQKELKQIYALPGLGIKEALQGDVLLRQAGGYSANESFNIMKQFGNAIALGGGGKEQFALVLTQLTQMSTKTKVLAEDLKPLINQAPVAAGAIRKLFGTVDSEQISKQLEKAGKGPREFISILTEELSKGERVTSGFRNGVENLQDSLTVAGDIVGQSIDRNALLTESLGKAADGIENLAKWFDSLSDSDQRAILGVLAFTAAVGPAVFIVGSLAGSIVNLANAKKVLVTALGVQRTAMIASLGPYALLAAAATLAVVSIVKFANAQEASIKPAKELADVSKQAAEASDLELSKLKPLIQIAGDERRSKEERAKALFQLQSQYPEYFKNLDIENLKTTDLKKSYDLLAKSIVNSTLARAKQEKLDQLVRGREKARENVNDKRANFKSTQANQKNIDDAAKAEGFVGSNTGQVAVDQAAKGLKTAKLQLEEYDKAINSTADDIVKLTETTKKSKQEGNIFGGVGGTDTKGRKGSDIDAAINLLEKLRNVEQSVLESRRKLNDIENDGREQQRKIYGMDISDGLKWILILENIIATERKLEQARKEVALDRIINRPKLTPSRSSTQDYLAARATSNANAVMNPFYREQKSNVKVQRKGELEQIIAQANNIDLSKPLDSVQRQLMDFLVGMNQNLRQGAADAFIGMGEVVGGLIAGTAGVKDLPKMLLGVVGGMFQQMGQAYITFGITSSSLIPTLTNPFTAGFGAIAAGIAMTALGAGLKAATTKQQKFAKGGIAYGEVFGNNAVAGEYSNVRTNPEVIAPLKDLTGILKPFWQSTVTETAQAQMAPTAGRSVRHVTVLNLDGREVFRVMEEYRENERRWANE